MKGTVTFFLLLCFHLLKGYDVGYTVVPHGKMDFPLLYAEKANPAEGDCTVHDCLLADPGDSGEEDDDLAGIEDEDEDEVVFRKYAAAVKCFWAFYASSFWPPSSGNLLVSLSVDKPPSYTDFRKYIAQRVLKI